MCEATTIIYAVAAVVSATATYQSVSAQKDAANYQAEVQRNNAKTSDQMARDALERGNLNEQAARRRSAQLFGTQRAVMAARGLDISEGSPLAILEDTAYFGEVDQVIARANTEREAWGYRVQGSNQSANAGLLKMQADAMNPLFSAGASLMGSASGVADRWYKRAA